MRFKEFIKEDTEQLNEINFKQAATAGLIGAASLFGGNAMSMTPQEQYRLDMANAIAHHYRINPDQAKEIVDAAHSEAEPVFPKAHDLLALTGVESSFNPNARAKAAGPKTQARIKTDTPYGLLQVRPGIWKLPSDALSTIKGQMHHGKEVLKYYYKKFHGDKEAAMNAFHMGETDFRKHGASPVYTQKYYAELERQKQLRAAQKQARYKEAHAKKIPQQ
jgi:hypothetical protein